jgi:hypothetical protein
MEVDLFGRTEKIRFNNPTALAALAIGGLCMARLQRAEGRRGVERFLDAGGIPAVVRLLKKPTCPVTLQYTASTIGTLLSWRMGLFHRHGLSPDPADTFLEAGEREPFSHGWLS